VRRRRRRRSGEGGVMFQSTFAVTKRDILTR